MRLNKSSHWNQLLINSRHGKRNVNVRRSSIQKFGFWFYFIHFKSAMRNVSGRVYYLWKMSLAHFYHMKAGNRNVKARLTETFYFYRVLLIFLSNLTLYKLSTNTIGKSNLCILYTPIIYIRLWNFCYRMITNDKN